MDFTNRRQPAPCRAMTLLDVLFVIFVVLISDDFIPATGSFQKQSKRTWWVTNVKEIGIAYEIWAGENHEKLPFELSVANGGTREQSLAGNVAYTFKSCRMN